MVPADVADRMADMAQRPFHEGLDEGPGVLPNATSRPRYRQSGPAYRRGPAPLRRLHERSCYRPALGRSNVGFVLGNPLDPLGIVAVFGHFDSGLLGMD